MRYQTYVLHLIDGTAIPMVEDYDLPAEKGIVGHFSKAAPDEIFTVGDLSLIHISFCPRGGAGGENSPFERAEYSAQHG